MKNLIVAGDLDKYKREYASMYKELFDLKQSKNFNGFYRGNEATGFNLQIGSLNKQTFFSTINYSHRIYPGTIVKIEIMDIDLWQCSLIISIITTWNNLFNTVKNRTSSIQSAEQC